MLDVEFTSGTKYRYFAVPERVFHEFLAAESKGVFFNRRIKPCYPLVKVDA
jgi:lysyl-tRNA synthetase class 2